MDDEKRKRYIQRALNKAYFYLKFRPRTKKEVQDYLHKKSEYFKTLTPEIIDESINKLEEQGFVNDAAFVAWYVEQRTTHKHKGNIAIKHELSGLGIDKETMEFYFLENPVDQEKQAVLAIQTRWQRYKQYEKQVRFQKVAAYLSRKGFTFDVIKKTIAQMENSE